MLSSMGISIYLQLTLPYPERCSGLPTVPHTTKADMIRPECFSGPCPRCRAGVLCLRLIAINTALRCEIRSLVMHVYPDGIKAFGRERPRCR